jgi:hypothetical protein
MKQIELIKIKDCSNLIKQTPKKEHYTTLINEDCLFIKDGKAVGLYLKIKSPNLNLIRKASLTTKFVKTYRAHQALPTQSSVFGSLPRVAIRNDYCRFSGQTKNEKTNTNILFNFLPELIEIYKKYLPEQYSHDLSVIEENVDDSYIIEKKAPFTTANINVNHAIKYHKDTGNFRGNLSNVLILRDGIKGGELVFPEYGFALAQEDSYLAIFDGQSEIHGVMPIIKTKENPYRCSIVYYTLENMKHCYPFKMELERLQNVATLRANKRSKNIDPRSKK